MSADDEPRRDGDRRSDLAVMDAQEYKQKRRLERLLDAHDQVEQKASEAWALYAEGTIDHDAKNITIQRAVKRGIRECYNLLMEHVAELDEGELSEYWHGKEGEPLGMIQFDYEEDIPIWGLRDFLQTQEFYTESWVETHSRRHQTAEKVRHTQTHTIPESVCWSAYMRLKKFLSTEQDLEIQFEKLDGDVPNWGYEAVSDDEIPDDVEVI